MTKAMYQNNRNENKFIEKERNMEKRIKYCHICGKPVDIDDCNTDSMWTNDGDRIVYHVCPYCENSVEDTGSI